MEINENKKYTALFNGNKNKILYLPTLLSALFHDCLHFILLVTHPGDGIALRSEINSVE